MVLLLDIWRRQILLFIIIYYYSYSTHHNTENLVLAGFLKGFFLSLYKNVGIRDVLYQNIVFLFN